MQHGQWIVVVQCVSNLQLLQIYRNRTIRPRFEVEVGFFNFFRERIVLSPKFIHFNWEMMVSGVAQTQ